MVASARGVGFTASLGSSKAMTKATGDLGYKFGPGELYHQPFFSDNDVPEGGIDLEACPSEAAESGIYQTVYNCLGGGSGCLTPESGCRDCTTNGDAGQYPNWLPICPCSVCVHFGLDYSKCDIDCPPPSPSPPSPSLPPLPPSPPPQPSPPPPPPSPPSPPLAPPYTGSDCIGTKYFSEFRSGDAWSRVQQKYVKTPNNGKTVHEYTRDGRKARAIMIFPKGVKGRTTIKKPGGWPQTQYAGPNANSWWVMTSNDGCGKPLFDSGGGNLNPGEWNVYLSRTTFKASNGVYFETYPNDRDSSGNYYKTWGGSNITVGMVEENWGADFFRDNGCVGENEEMPIANTDIQARIAYDISGEGNQFGEYNLQFVDEYQNKKEYDLTAQGSMEWCGFRSEIIPLTASCAWMR